MKEAAFMARYAVVYENTIYYVWTQCPGEPRANYTWAFPGGSVVKNLPANAGDPGSIPGPGRSPGEGNDNPLQYSCLENSMDRGAW